MSWRENMDLREFAKLKILLPIFVGIILGLIFIFVRAIDDIPGLSISFVILCFCLIFYGVYNINRINKKIKPKIIVPLLFGVMGIIYALILLSKGESEDSPGVFVLMGALCIGLIFIGTFNIKEIRQKIDPGIVVPSFYGISGSILTIILELDGEITKQQRTIAVVIFILIGVISIGTIMLIRKINMARRNCI
jgi:drug/metabolite transporter (DMT)-like permease